MSIPLPNYSRVPNCVLEIIGEMSEAELKVTLVIIRNTFGWQRDLVPMSIKDLQEGTGLSRQSVMNGINAGMERGTISRRSKGRSFLYGLCVKNLDTSESQNENLRVQNLDRKEGSDGLKFRPPINKEERNIFKESNTSSSLRSEGTQSRQLDNLGTEEKTPSEHQQMFAKVCEIVGWDYRTLDGKSKGRVAQTLGILQKANYTLEELNRFGVEVWRNDWRWKKNRQRPTLEQLRQEIGQLRAPSIAASQTLEGWQPPKGNTQFTVSEETRRMIETGNIPF